MKVMLLSDPNSPHTIKWATSLVEEGLDIFIFGLGELIVNDYGNFKNIRIFTMNQKVYRVEGSFSKLRYLKSLPVIRKIIREFKPHIIHAHYATSYGLLGALSNFHPFVVSVWGSDVFSFPKKSLFHKMTLKFIFKKADKILSTSKVMAREAALYTNKEIEITPFGIDINQFRPMVVDSLFDKNDIVIGTVKTLEEEYGIEYLIRSFKIISDKYPFLPLKLLIVGGGSLERYLKDLCKNLNIENKVIFTGKVPYSDVPKYHNMLSVFVTISNSESFGVAVIEASACEKPVVVSNVGGLPEVVESDVTGFIVPPRNPEKTAEAIERLILDKPLRERMGKDGRKRVIKFYNWENNVAQMIELYKNLL